MKKSITWGAVAGALLGATATFALSHGWVELPWNHAAAAEHAPRAQHDEPQVHGARELHLDAAPVRPLRPGSTRAGAAAPTVHPELSRA